MAGFRCDYAVGAIATVTLLLLPTLPTGLSEGAGSLTLLQSVEVDESTYVAWRVVVPAGTIVRIEAEGVPVESNQLAFAAWAVSVETGDVITRPSALVVADPLNLHAGSNLYLDASVSIDPELCGIAYQQGLPPCSLGAWREFDLHSGEWILIAVAGTDGHWLGRIALYSDSEASILARRVGAAFFAREPAFGGTVNVNVDGLLVHAGMVQDGSFSQLVSSSMYASYAGITETEQLTMSYSGPEGSLAGSTEYLLSGLGPGQYRFHLDVVDAHVIPVCCSIVWLVGADVSYP